jgi:hypothetical protein
MNRWSRATAVTWSPRLVRTTMTARMSVYATAVEGAHPRHGRASQPAAGSVVEATSSDRRLPIIQYDTEISADGR